MDSAFGLRMAVQNGERTKEALAAVLAGGTDVPVRGRAVSAPPMSLFTEIDRLLRHSVLARAQPFLRARTPWLHHALLVSRDVFLPFTSAFGLHRYQHRAIERFLSF